MRVFPPSARVLRTAALSGGVLLGACAYGLPSADPADIPRLENRLAAHPGDAETRVRLGMARFAAGENEAARELLQSAVDAGHLTGPALLYLGMSEEELGRWVRARTAYATYLEVNGSGPMADEVRRRLRLLGRRALKEQAREALAREEELDAVAAAPRSVAVLPFAFVSDRVELEPLIWALSDMMTTDLAVSDAVTVLERARIQALLDEMALTEAGYADQRTGARAGRLLAAEHVVQGVLTTLGPEEVRLESDVLNVPRGASAGTVSAEDALTRLFRMEKELVIGTLRDVLGVELTPAEEQAVLDNRVDNVLAFLAYGRGLRDRDRGAYGAALAEFRRAAELDPGFAAAQAAVEETAELQEAQTTTTAELARTASATGETGGVRGALSPPPPAVTGALPPGGSVGVRGTAGILGSAGEAVNPTPTLATLGGPGTSTGAPGAATTAGQVRDPVQEAQGTEGSAAPTTVQIRIVIRVPGGKE